MAINFPNSPTLDDEYTDPTTDIVWKWDGSSWERIFEDFNFSQKVGIGTVDPQEEIHVKAQVPVIRLEDTDGGYMQIVGSDGNIRFDADNAGSISGSNILFNIDNNSRMIIDASGQVGIGTTSPSQLLQVGGDVRGQIYIKGTGSTSPTLTLDHTSYTDGRKWTLYSGGARAANFDIYDLSTTPNATPRFSIDENGNVGIGETTPVAKLDIISDITGSGQTAGTTSDLKIVNNSSTVQWHGGLTILHPNTSNTNSALIQFGNASTTGNSGHLSFVNSDTDGEEQVQIGIFGKNSLLNIQGNGNVGIGITSPNKKLHVTDSNEIVATLTNSTNAAATKTLLRFSQNNDTDLLAGTIGINRLGANAGCGFEINLADSNGAEQNRLTILEGGNVGIGTTSPQTKLHVSGPNTEIVQSKVSSTDVEIGVIAYQNSHAEIRVGTNHPLLFKTNDNNERMRITSGGDVEILNDVEINGVLTMNSTSQYQLNLSGSNDGKILLTGVNPYMRFRESATPTVDKSYIQWHSGGYLYLRNQEDSSGLRIKGDLDFTLDGTTFHSVYHEGNFTPTWTSGTGLIYYNSGNVGIGTSSPSAKLHIHYPDLSAATISNPVPAISVGEGSQATGHGSIALGQDCLSSGVSHSIAMGAFAKSTGQASVAMGWSTEANGDYSTAMGYTAIANGDYSTAIGKSMTVNGDYSFGVNLTSGSNTLTQANTMTIMGGKVGIGTTTPSEVLEISRGESGHTGDSFLKIKNTVMTTGANNGRPGIILERKLQDANSNYVDRDYTLRFEVDGDLRLRQDGTTIYRFDDSNLEHVFEDDVKVDGNVTLSGVTEKFGTYNTDITSTAAIDFDSSSNKLWLITSLQITNNWTINVTNLNLSAGEATNLSFVVSQPFASNNIPNAFQIGGASQTIKWEGGSAPTGTASQIDMFSFTIFCTSSNSYTVLGNMVNFS